MQLWMYPKTTHAPDTLAKFALHHIWLSKERWGFVYRQCSLILLMGVLFDSSTQEILQLIIILYGAVVQCGPGSIPGLCVIMWS